MSIAKKVEKLVLQCGDNQTALADLVGVDRSAISNYVSGRRDNVEPIVCLFFAGVTNDPVDRAYWLRHAFDERELELASRGINGEVQFPIKYLGSHQLLQKLHELGENRDSQQINAIMQAMLAVIEAGREKSDTPDSRPARRAGGK